MQEFDQHLKDISEIRSMMERSSKFLSLSGLSGVSAGIVALAGAAVAYWKTQQPEAANLTRELVHFLVADAALVLVIAVSLTVFFSIRLARKKNLPFWNNTARFLLADLVIPLITAGIVMAILYKQNMMVYLAPLSLVFYGLALLNASKYTFRAVRYLAVSEVVLGLFALIWLDWQLWFWAFGFGVLHIAYGIFGYWKLEK
ncbi:MAG: hypothetical protein HYY49_04795 [Ignavibacteriales bacterium]|nr:hypothetical protein [Ignavibacteriales bacterium]